MSLLRPILTGAKRLLPLRRHLRRSRHLRRALIAAMMIACVGSATPSFALVDDGAKIGAEPVASAQAAAGARSYFAFNARPGGRFDSGIRVVNNGTATGTVRLYPVDATTGQTSGTVFMLRDDLRRGVGSWVEIDGREITLQPGEVKEVPFSVTVPGDARAGHHVGAIVVEDTLIQGLSADGRANAQVMVQKRLAVALQLTLPGEAVERIEATQIRAGGDDGFQTLLVRLQNDGAMMLRPAGSLTVVNQAGQRVQDLSLQLDTVLPKTAIEYPVFVEGQALGPGVYRADLVLNYGDRKQSVFSTDFTISSQQVAQTFEARKPLVAPTTIMSGVPTLALPSRDLSWLLIALTIVALLIPVRYYWTSRGRFSMARGGARLHPQPTRTHNAVESAATLTMAELSLLGRQERLAVYQLLASSAITEETARAIIAERLQRRPPEPPQLQLVAPVGAATATLWTRATRAERATRTERSVTHDLGLTAEELSRLSVDDLQVLVELVKTNSLTATQVRSLLSMHRRYNSPLRDLAALMGYARPFELDRAVGAGRVTRLRPRLTTDRSDEEWTL